MKEGERGDKRKRLCGAFRMIRKLDKGSIAAS